MRRSASIVGWFLWIAVSGVWAEAPQAAGENDVIRLLPPSGQSALATPAEQVEIGAPRVGGFSYAAFEARLESLWFQRKTLMASGRDADATEKLEEIRLFCTEEGIKRLEHLSGALLAETHRFLGEGNHQMALSSLQYAEAFDPNRPQVHLARAEVYWKSGRGAFAAVGELWRALTASVARSVQDLSLLSRLVFVLGLALLCACLTFSVLMMLRHQSPFRHEIEEWCSGFLAGRWPEVAGWGVLLLPLIAWIGAGWTAVYWMVITFRFMNRREKTAVVGLLLAGALTVPVYAVAVGLYGASADPSVRTTVTSVEGEYDPDRVVRLRRLVEAHPEDPVYHFLLAGLYKNGRYFDEAFQAYKAVLKIDPSFAPAFVNLGNIFYATGQQVVAINNYNKALQLESDLFLAHFNLHLAQSEAFSFGPAEQSLRKARDLDADRVASLLAEDYVGDRPAAQDATLRMVSVWESAVGGGTPTLASGHDGAATFLQPRYLVNAFGAICVAALLGLTAIALLGRGAELARRCIRCGRTFCWRCKSTREGNEYCSQCLHLFVLRDGLAPETKSKKLYEVERHERATRRARLLAAALLPGAPQLLRGKTGVGLFFLVLWFAALTSAAPEILSLGTEGSLSLSTDLLMPTEVPTRFDQNPMRFAAILLLPVIWIAGNFRLLWARGI